ncbi:MAG: hypothetical protein QXU98_10205 [Candidatus Parvarchaeota archaeon]
MKTSDNLKEIGKLSNNLDILLHTRDIKLSSSEKETLLNIQNALHKYISYLIKKGNNEQ